MRSGAHLESDIHGRCRAGLHHDAVVTNRGEAVMLHRQVVGGRGQRGEGSNVLELSVVPSRVTLVSVVFKGEMSSGQKRSCRVHGLDRDGPGGRLRRGHGGDSSKRSLPRKKATTAWFANRLITYIPPCLYSKSVFVDEKIHKHSHPRSVKFFILDKAPFLAFLN